MLISMSISGLLMFIMSLTQVSQKTDTAIRSSSQWDDVCTDDYIQYTRPFQFTQDIGNANYGPFICPWPVSLSTYRATIAILCFLIAALVAYRFDFAQAGGVTMYIFSGFFFSSAVLDSHALRIGTDTCGQDFYNAIAPSSGFNCETGAFVFTVLLGYWCFFQAFLTAGILMRFQVTRTVVQSTTTSSTKTTISA